MKLTGKIKELSQGYTSGKMILSLEINEQRDLLEGYDELSAREKISIDLTPFKEKRSLDANAYLWKLLGELAKVLKIGNEEIYRHYIREMGIYDVLPVRNDSVQRFCEAWKKQGIGWIAEPIKESKIPNYTNVITFYGSSVYNKDEFSRLVNQVVEDCKEQGIQTEPQERIDALVEAYYGKEHNSKG